MNNQRTVADVILDQLASWGVKRIYGYTGDTILTFLDAVSRHPQIEFVSTRHEGAAAFMASAEAKLTGRIGVCTATCGPGAANLINGLADASKDRAPVLAITGQVETKHLGTDYKQYINESILMEPIAKYSSLVVSPESTVEIFYKGLQVAMNQGTVAHIAVCKDIFQQPCTNQPRSQDNIYPAHKTPEEQGISHAVSLLKNASKPTILVGRGAIGKGELVEKLADSLGAAITYTMPAIGVISSDYKYLVGGLGLAGTEAASDLLKQSDCLLTIGSTWWPENFVPQNIPILQIDGILENIGTQSKIKLGIEGCIQKILESLVAGVKRKPNQDWVNTIKSLREKWLADLEKDSNSNSNPITPQRLVAAVEKAVNSEGIIALDVGDHVLWFDKIFRGKGQNVLISGSWRSMGFGVPAALSAKLEYPNRQVVALVGDGGLSMVLGELITVAEKNANIKVVVFNNKSLSMEKNRTIVAGLSDLGTNLYNPDFVKIAEACGIEGYKVSDVNQLDDIIGKAFNSDKPALVDVDVSIPIPAHTSV